MMSRKVLGLVTEPLQEPQRRGGVFASSLELSNSGKLLQGQIKAACVGSVHGVDTATKLFYRLCPWRQYRLILFIQKLSKTDVIFKRLIS